QALQVQKRHEQRLDPGDHLVSVAAIDLRVRGVQHRQRHALLGAAREDAAQQLPEQTVAAVRGMDHEAGDPAAVRLASAERDPVAPDPCARGEDSVGWGSRVGRRITVGREARVGRNVDPERDLAGREALRCVWGGGIEAAAEGAGGHRAIGDMVRAGEIPNWHAGESRRAACPSCCILARSPTPRGGAVSPRRDRKPFTRPSSAQRSAREKLSRRLSAGDPRSEQHPRRRIPVGLSTSSVFPAGVEEAFRLAQKIGYDGMEIMVSYPKDSQDPAILREYSERYELPILSLHAPTLFFLQGLWGRDAWVKIERTIEIAKELEVPTIVSHPPFRWQGKYAHGFVEGVARLEDEHGIPIAVENMYPWRLGVREVLNYLPDHDPTDEDYAHVTVDLSHAATAGDDALEMIERLGDKLTHLHL